MCGCFRCTLNIRAQKPLAAPIRIDAAHGRFDAGWGSTILDAFRLRVTAFDAVRGQRESPLERASFAVLWI